MKQPTAASVPVCSNADNSMASSESRTSDPARTTPDNLADLPLQTSHALILGLSDPLFHSYSRLDRGYM